MTMTPAEHQEPAPGAPAQARRRRAGQRAVDQDRTLLAMHQLEAALGAAAPRREQAWLGEVRRALGVLGEAAAEEARNAAQPDSLLSDITRTQPWLRNRARGLRIHYRQLQDGIAALEAELDAAAGQAVGLTRIRPPPTRGLAALPH